MVARCQVDSDGEVARDLVQNRSYRFEYSMNYSMNTTQHSMKWFAATRAFGHYGDVHVIVIRDLEATLKSF